jgi:hypothetical protein
VAKHLALAITSHTQSALLAVVGIQIFKRFAPLSMARPSVRMFAHPA